MIFIQKALLPEASSLAGFCCGERLPSPGHFECMEVIYDGLELFLINSLTILETRIIFQAALPALGRLGTRQHDDRFVLF